MGVEGVSGYPRGMQCSDVLTVLRRLAPERLAESWDRVGLHLGDESWSVERAMLCIDLTEPVMCEAVEQGVNLIVAYHPPIFAPLKSVTAEHWKGRVVLEAIQRKIAVYSPHTALDAAAGGVNDWLCESVLPGLMHAVSREGGKGEIAAGGSVQAIRSIAPAQSRRPYKLVTFIPLDHLDVVRQALCEAGAGQIGDYSECTFSIEGEGTFRGGESTNPTVGQRGRLERAVERRMETVVPANRLASVVAALMKAHPYEEPAFDLIRLELPPEQGGEGVGQGRVVTLDEPMDVDDLVMRIKRHLGVERLDVAVPDSPGGVRRIGFCAGAGGSLLEEAGEVDAFFTGEMRHHDVLDAVQRGVTVVLAGHTQTERPYLPIYRDRIEAAGGTGVQWVISEADRPPM